MANLADIIERFILGRLNEAEEIVVLQRNELANELECAPSQISYVINTRFTTERGFIVESRRGLGGHIRISRVSTQSFSTGDSLMSLSDVESSLWRLRESGLLSNREQRLILTMFRYFEQAMGDDERHYLLRSVLKQIGN